MKSKNFNKKKLALLSAVILFMSIFILTIPSVSSVYPNDTPDLLDYGFDMTWPGVDDEITRNISGAVWCSLPSTEATGSGVFHAFFRVQADGSERGYNTDGRPLQFDEKTSKSFTHSALLVDVPLVNYTKYFPEADLFYEFQLDINQLASSSFMSLDYFQVWTTNNKNQLGYDHATHSFTSGATLIYDLHDNGDPNWIKMDYRWNTGSGKRDYRVLIPDDMFSGITDKYVIIYTEHGLKGLENETNDGFEEWGVKKIPTEPDTYVDIFTSDDDDIVQCGDVIALNISEANSGTQELMDINVTVKANGIEIPQSPLNIGSPYYIMGDDNDDGFINLTETWVWNITGVVVDGDTNFSVYGKGYTIKPHGHSGPDKEISYNTGHLDELDYIIINVTSCISGYKLNECGEVGLPGWNITLWDDEDNFIDYYITEADGYYEFCDLELGDYIVNESADNDWINWYNVSDISYDVSLECEKITNLNFTNHPYMCINGTKYDNCTLEPIDGVRINLTTYPGGVLVDWTITANGGKYSFCDLEAGWYNVSEEVPVGYYANGPTWYHVELICDDLVQDFENNHPLMCIRGYKLDESGYGLSGWNISLYDDQWHLLDWILTGLDGNYSFCDLEAGTYYVNETLQEGWTNISPISITVHLECDNVTDQNFTNTPNLCYGSETAWAYGGQYANENWNYTNSNNWGWTNGPLSGGYYEFELWAGAGQNILDNGELVGMVYVNYTGGCVNVTYETYPGYYIGETHLWVGSNVLPKKKGIFTSAPGQFPYGENIGFEPGQTMETSWIWESCPNKHFTGNIYVAAHAVVWMEVECEV